MNADFTLILLIFFFGIFFKTLMHADFTLILLIFFFGIFF